MEKILVLNFNGDCARQIAKKIRACRVFAEIMPHDISAEEIKDKGFLGIVLAGGGGNVHDTGALRCDRKILTLGIPVLGIGYGALLLAEMSGGDVEPRTENGDVCEVYADSSCILLSDLPQRSTCFMPSRTNITRVPTGFRITAKAEGCAVAAMENSSAGLYAVQFHPESDETKEGLSLFKNFLYRICGTHAEWTSLSFIRRAGNDLRERLKDNRVLCPLYGDMASAVTALLLYKAGVKNLNFVFFNHGLFTNGEAETVKTFFSALDGISFAEIDAKSRFLGRLIGITEGKSKMRIVTEEITRMLKTETDKLESTDFLALPALYGDTNNTPHGDFENTVSPISYLLEEEARAVGAELGLPKTLSLLRFSDTINSVRRITGEITPEKYAVLCDCDTRFKAEMRTSLGNAEYYCFTELDFHPSQDDFTVILHASSRENNKETRHRLPVDALERAAQKIKRAVNGAERILYDITP